MVAIFHSSYPPMRISTNHPPDKIMKTDKTSPPALRSPAERLLHATVFEVIALLICAPVLAWAMGTSLAHMGALTLAISLIAMGWNMLFNAAFDRLQQRWGFQRTLAVRVAHAVSFELGLIVAVVPLAAWWLEIGLWEALLLDIGVLLFFLPYAIAFNCAWDTLRPPRAGSIATKVDKQAATQATTPPATGQSTCAARS